MSRKSSDKTLEHVITFLLLIPVVVFYLLKFFFNIIKQLLLFIKKKIRYNNVNLDEIDEMSGIAFEYFIA